MAVLFDQFEQPALHHRHHAGQFVPALQHLPSLTEQGPHSLPLTQRRPLFQLRLRPLRSPAEGAKNCVFTRKIKRVVAPLPGRHHAAVKIENTLQFPAIETDHRWRGGKSQDRRLRLRRQLDCPLRVASSERRSGSSDARIARNSATCASKASMRCDGAGSPVSWHGVP